MSDRKDAFRRAAMDSLIRANNLALTDSLLNDEWWPKNAERRKTAISRLARVADEIAAAMCGEEVGSAPAQPKWLRVGTVHAVTRGHGHGAYLTNYVDLGILKPGSRIRFLGEFERGESIVESFEREHALINVHALPPAVVQGDVIEVLTHV